MLKLLCVGLCTTGGTSELNGADNSVLGVHQFEAFEVEVADLEGLAEAEVVNVDHETLGDGGVGSFHANFLHRESELTTGFHTFGVAFELNGNFDGNGLLVVYFEKVNVEDGILYGVELDVLEHGHAFFAVNVEFDSEDIGSVDQLANGVVGYGKIGGDEAFAVTDFYDFFAFAESAVVGEVKYLAAIEHYGDQVVFTESLGGFFAEVCTGFGSELECFHCQSVD